MATVNGLTKERMLEIEAKCVVDGAVDLSGNLSLIQRDGTKIDAGNVKGPKGDVGPAASSLNAWPVGCIFMNVTPTSPSLLLGGGTWVRWGQGRVPVSLREEDGRFSYTEAMGGEYEHVLSEGEMPYHNHDVYDPTHNHDSNWHPSSVEAAGYSLYKGNDQNGFQNRAAVGGGGYVVTGARATGISIYARGGNYPHNNIQPYITCYFWKRTA